MNWTDAIIRGAGIWDQLDRFDDLGSYVESELEALEEQTVTGTQFQPFTVSSNLGATTGGPGGVQYNLSDQQQGMSDNLNQYAGGLFASAAGDQSGREADAYEKIRALQRPGEERAMMSTEARAAAQGRLGVSGANYAGSTPEMLALQEQIGQNRNRAALGAIGEARAQQAQDANIGSTFQNNAMLPYAMQQNMFGQGLQNANMVQAGQIGGQNLAAQLGLGRITAGVNSEKVRAELMANLFNTAGGAFSSNNVDPVGAFGGWLGGILGIPGFGG